jgi:hypothetical protein
MTGSRGAIWNLYIYVLVGMYHEVKAQRKSFSLCVIFAPYLRVDLTFIIIYIKAISDHYSGR